MHITQRQEQFSNSYIRAVASVAGYSLYKPEVDDDSIDLGIAAKGVEGTIRSPRLELQLKCPLKKNVVAAKSISYSIKIKNYDDLRTTDVLVPRILVVVVVPDDIKDWLQQSEKVLLMKHCGYWVSLRGKPPTPNNQTVTVSLSQTQLFTVEALTSLMSCVAQGGFP
jgi:hypothetical protein